MTIKSNPCKLCSSVYHTAAFCPQKPRKVIKKSPIKVTRLNQNVILLESPAVYRPPKKRKSTKTKTRSQLVRDLDKVFSQYIRVKDSIDGIAVCVTCGDQKPWRQQQNGHYMSRGHYPTRWDEDNCHVQCVACNMFRSGNYTEYSIYMINRYGADFLPVLRDKAKNGSKIHTSVIKGLIEEYTQKLLTYSL